MRSAVVVAGWRWMASGVPVASREISAVVFVWASGRFWARRVADQVLSAKVQLPAPVMVPGPLAEREASWSCVGVTLPLAVTCVSSIGGQPDQAARLMLASQVT